MTREEIKDNIIFFEKGNIIYIPIHLNNYYILSYNLSAVKIFEDDQVFMFLNEFIGIDKDKKYILDFSGILEERRTFDKLFKNKNVIAVNVHKKIIERLDGIIAKDNKNLGYIKTNINKLLIYNEKCDLVDIEMLDQFLAKDLGEVLDKNPIIKQTLDDINKKCVETLKERKYLSSSNVYAKQYLYTKRLFCWPKELKIIIYYLSHKIYYFVSQKIFIGQIFFISSSSTGSALANIVKFFFTHQMKYLVKDFSETLIDKRSIHLLHIGPHHIKKNFEITHNDYRNSGFIYIYDFMCLGTEYKLVKEYIGNIKDAQLLGAFGMAHFRFPRDEKDLYSFSDVSKWEDKYKYNIYTEEK